MPALDWILAEILMVLYAMCLIKVCSLPILRGDIVLDLTGIFAPILSLLGAMLLPRARFPLRRRRDRTSSRSSNPGHPIDYTRPVTQ